MTVCHRTAAGEFIPITVADRAVSAHLDHGDGLVGDPVPGEAGSEFDADCTPVLTRQVTTTQGSWDGTTYRLGTTFTVSTEGPVSATATVTGADPSWPLRLFLLGYQAGAPNPPGNCSTTWLPELLPAGPDSYPPTVSAEWDAVPAGTYCLNVVSAVPVPPYPAPYSWTVTVTYR